MKQLILLFLLGMTTYSNAQNFDIADFNKKLAVAEWLSIYDNIAWWTSDSVMIQPKEKLDQLGSEWFCFQEDDLWHAVYGKFENDNFDLVFHFTVKSRNEVTLTKEPVDTSLLNSYSRTLQTATQSMRGIRDSINLRFNQYIKRNDDETITVWILPAFQTNGMAVYGGEFIFNINKTGHHILSTNHYFKGDFYGLKANGSSEEFYINYKELEKPTVGGIFFASYYAPYFKKVVLVNKNSRSIPFYMDGEWTWIHADDTGMNESKKKSKKKKRRKN